MTTENNEQEPIFSETDEMYALTDLIQEFEFIDSKNLDYSIGGESKEDLENEVSNYLEDLHAEMVELVNFINDNFKDIKVEIPVSGNLDRWIKYYRKQIDRLENKEKEYKNISGYYTGYNKGEIIAYKSIVRTLVYMKGRIES